MHVHNFSSLERQRRYWGDCPLCLFICQVTTFLVPLVIQCTWNASEEDNQQSSLWNTILNNLLVILAFKVLPPWPPHATLVKVDVVIFCLGFNLSVMLRAYAHNLQVGGGGEYVGFGAGGINFHPKHWGGHQNSIGNLYGGGALKTYFDNRSGLEKFLKE